MDTREAAERWARTWAEAWPVRDADAIVALHAEDGDHWASLFQQLRGRVGLRGYVEDCFDEETRPAQTWFADPQVDGDTAVVEYWVVTYPKDQPMTICGCTLLRFDDSGLVTQARDYSQVKEGHLSPPDDVLTWRWTH